MLQFFIKYYDGKSSKPSDAILKISEGDFSVFNFILYEEISISSTEEFNINEIDASSNLEESANDEDNLISNLENKINIEDYPISKEEDVISIKEHSFTWNLKDVEWEKIHHKIEFRLQNPKGAYFVVENADFKESFLKYLKEHRQLNIYSKLMEMSTQKFIVISITLLGLVALAYIFILPLIAEKSVHLLPISFDQKLGNMFYHTYAEQNPIDSQKTKWLQSFANEIDFGSERQLNFTVVKSEEVNAFALPNGQIVIFSGIIKNMRSTNELAGLLGHEAAHVLHRHSAQMISRNVAGYLLISVLLSDVNGIMAIIAENAHQLHSLTYSRKYEKEADETGLEILLKNNIDPHGMVELFEHLDEERDVELPQILSTHPLTKERKKNMEALIEQSEFKAKTQPKLDSLFQLLTQEDFN